MCEKSLQIQNFTRFEQKNPPIIRLKTENFKWLVNILLSFAQNYFTDNNR